MIAVCLIITFGLVGCMKEANINNNTIDAESDYQSSDVLQKDETVPAEVKVMQKTENTVAEEEKIVEASETTGAVDEAADTETDVTKAESREILITQEENEQLEYWLKEYQLSPKGLEEDLLQLRGNLELDMDEACYPELRESLERYAEQLRQHNDMNSYQVIVHRADKNILSFWELQSDLGSYIGYNFDTASGKALSIYDIIFDMDAFSTIVAEQLQKSYPDIRFGDNLTNKIKEIWKQSANFAWTMEYQGISCLFSAEAFETGTSEVLQVMIPFADISELIAEQYQQIPEAYVIELNEKIPFIYDVGGDGSFDKISINRYFNDEDKSTGVKINELTSMGKYAYPTVYGENSRAYLVHMEEHKDYIIFYEEGDWDCSGEYVVYIAENNKIEYIGCESIYLENVRITNPGVVKIKNSTEPLLSGILQTEAYGFVAESGFLQTDNLDYYYLDSDRIVKTLVPLSVSSVDPYTGEIVDEKINLPAGSYMKLLRTDLLTWCDFVLTDGQVCRLIFDEPVSDMVPKHDGQKVLGECLFLE